MEFHRWIMELRKWIMELHNYGVLSLLALNKIGHDVQNNATAPIFLQSLAPRADPGFEVRGGANGLENFDSIYISHIRFILYTLFSSIFYILTPLLVQYCNKNSYFEKIWGGARPVRPPLNPPLGTPWTIFISTVEPLI